MSTIFDIIDETETIEEPVSDQNPQSLPQNIQSEPEDIFDMVKTENVQPEKQEQPWWQSVPLDVLKGIIEGVSRVGQMMGPLPPKPFQPPFSMEKFTEQLDELIPTDSNVVGKGARRALNIAGPALSNPLAGPVKAGIQSVAGGAGGQAVEEMGGGDLLQTAAEVIPFFFGGGIPGGKITQKSPKVSEALSKSKIIPEKIRNIMGKRAANRNEINELISFAEKNGMTAEEITPLIQGETKKIVLSKLSQRGGATAEKLTRSKQGITDIADRFKTGEFADIVLAEPQANKMINRLQDVLHDMPAKTRNVIMEDFTQLASSKKDTKSIIKFFRDINAQYGEHRAHLGRLKEPLMEGLATISPELAKDFNMTNKLFQKYYNISGKLKPNIATRILDASTVPKIMYGTFTGNYPLIVEAVGEVAARKFASEMLTNHRLQDISRKMVSALNKGQFAVADRIKDEYIRLLKDDYPEITAEMQKESFKEFIDN